MVKNTLIVLWKLSLCALAFYGGTMLGGMVASLLGLPTPEMPAGADQMVLGQVMLLISLILAMTLAILSRNLSGSFVARWLAISLLVWIAYGVNNILEGAIFTSMSAASLFTVVLYVVASLLCGAAVAWLFPPNNKGFGFLSSARNFFARYTAASWIWRFLVAFLAFPLVYLSFGRLIAPFVMPFYEQGLFNLTLPAWGQIMPVLFLRSLLFLLACLPVLILLQASAGRMFWVLGLTLFLLVGGLSMLQAYWFPTNLRLIHSLEILADELTYAGILIVLFKLPSIKMLIPNDKEKNMNETYTPTVVQDSVSGHYRQDLHWSVKGKPSRAIRIQLLSIPLAMLFGFAFIHIAIHIGKLPLNVNGGSFSFGFPEVGIGSVGIFATIILHELAHGLAMRWYGIRPQYGALWKNLIFYATAPGYGFRRNSYIVVALAPLVGLSCLAIMGMFLLQGTGWVALLTLCAIINASGAIGDLWMVSIILRYPKTVYVVDEKDGFRVLTRVTC